MFQGCTVCNPVCILQAVSLKDLLTWVRGWWFTKKKLLGNLFFFFKIDVQAYILQDNIKSANIVICLKVSPYLI